MDKPSYCIDAYAWVEYFIGSEKGRIVSTIVENSGNDVFMSAVTVAEVVSVTKREGRDWEAAFNKMLNLAKVSDTVPETAKKAGLLHAELRKNIKDFALADAFVLTTARRLGAKIVTGDPHFKNMKNVVFLS